MMDISFDHSAASSHYKYHTAKQKILIYLMVWSSLGSTMTLLQILACFRGYNVLYIILFTLWQNKDTNNIITLFSRIATLFNFSGNNRCPWHTKILGIEPIGSHHITISFLSFTCNKKHFGFQVCGPSYSIN